MKNRRIEEIFFSNIFQPMINRTILKITRRNKTIIKISRRI